VPAFAEAVKSRSGAYHVPLKEQGVMPYPALAIVLLIATLCLGTLYFILVPAVLTDFRCIATVALILTAFTLPSYIAVWGTEWTTIDLAVFSLFLIGLALGGALQGARFAGRRLLAPA
jgi:hypothetical protein